jgi:hypothetical protein
MILAALVLAASLSDLIPNPTSILIERAKGGGITITADGKPISCRELNDYMAKAWKAYPGRPLKLDCKTGAFINLPKQ